MSGVQSIERAFTVLACLRQGATGVSDIATRTQIPKSTVSRLLLTLADLGAVEPIAGGVGYRIGPTLFDLAALGGPKRSMTDVARPLLVELTQVSGEAAGMSVLAGNKVLCIESIESHTDIQVRDWTGDRADPHLVAGGFVLLSRLSSEAIDAVCPDPLAPCRPGVVADRSVLHDRVAAARRDGFVWVEDEFFVGLSTVAAPVVDRRSGVVVAAVHIHGPSFRFPQANKAQFADQVVATAGRISAAMYRDGVHPDESPKSNPPRFRSLG
jgi:DNA-binding IclR family transcriptional regulator